MYSTTLMASDPPEKFSKEAEKVGFVWVDPAPELLSGEVKTLAEKNNVAAEKTSGFWYGPRGFRWQVWRTGTCGTKRSSIISMVRGGFVMGTAHPSNGSMTTLANGLLEHFPANTRLFALEYRLSSHEPFAVANPFPAALLDALAGYKYLVESLRYDPKNIIIGGDSAGGTLAFWLARYLAISNLPNLPNAGGLLLLSPTVDWANTYTDRESSMHKHSSTDFVYTILICGYTLRALMGNLPLPDAPSNVWIAPGSKQNDAPGLFTGLPKTVIVAGGAEQTLDAMVVLRDRLERDLGKDNVKYIEKPDATHDYLTASWHEPERTETLVELGEWANDRIWSTCLNTTDFSS
ncbi:alpha/beta-hydrolase [Desarmillaria tabescens]|uniref:Alpha/beta-hydrolase n=1 Tax=Armillaria tabescens TaxID=1929756 RepID=A0AA39MX33_ARMTA|nr:alpha/beta-hydrolase [Desarmillaria tabescens]KAK0449837.1 alpha/beta-hydrolase [Desarmillaria tabescens]